MAEPTHKFVPPPNDDAGKQQLDWTEDDQRRVIELRRVLSNPNRGLVSRARRIALTLAVLMVAAGAGLAVGYGVRHVLLGWTSGYTEHVAECRIDIETDETFTGNSGGVVSAGLVVHLAELQRLVRDHAGELLQPDGMAIDVQAVSFGVTIEPDSACLVTCRADDMMQARTALSSVVDAYREWVDGRAASSSAVEDTRATLVERRQQLLADKQHVRQELAQTLDRHDTNNAAASITETAVAAQSLVAELDALKGQLIASNQQLHQAQQRLRDPQVQITDRMVEYACEEDPIASTTAAQIAARSVEYQAEFVVRSEIAVARLEELTQRVQLFGRSVEAQLSLDPPAGLAESLGTLLHRTDTLHAFLAGQLAQMQQLHRRLAVTEADDIGTPGHSLQRPEDIMAAAVDTTMQCRRRTFTMLEHVETLWQELPTYGHARGKTADEDDLELQSVGLADRLRRTTTAASLRPVYEQVIRAADAFSHAETAMTVEGNRRLQTLGGSIAKLDAQLEDRRRAIRDMILADELDTQRATARDAFDRAAAQLQSLLNHREQVIARATDQIRRLGELGPVMGVQQELSEQIAALERRLFEHEHQIADLDKPVTEQVHIGELAVTSHQVERLDAVTRGRVVTLASVSSGVSTGVLILLVSYVLTGWYVRWRS